MEKFLPDKAFTIILIGRTQSGKTTFTLNLLTQDWAYKNQFDLIYIISPTINEDPTIREWIDLPEDQLIGEFDEKFLETLFNAQRELVQENRDTAPEVLLILDDVIAEVNFKKNLTIGKIATRGRHIKISMIVNTQKHTAIPRVLRDNVSLVVFFSGLSFTELESVSREFFPGKPQIFKEFTSKNRFVLIKNNFGRSIFFDDQFRRINLL